MKTLVVNANHQLELKDFSEPKIGPYESIVKIQACGICATTDTELIRGTQPYNKNYPCILGHEAIGEIIETGSKVKKFSRGDFVTRPTALWPGEKKDGLTSAWGGFAEWGIVRDAEAMAADGNPSLLGDYVASRQNVVPKGTSLSDAVLAISLAETSSWFSHLGSVWGKSVCVAGTGVAGLGLALWAKFAGAKKVIVLGRRKERLDLALELAADVGINVKEENAQAVIRQATDGRGVDIFLEAVGAKDQLLTGFSAIAGGGIVAVYGVPPNHVYDFDWSRMPGHASVSQFPAEEHKTYAWVADLLKRGLIPGKKIMTHHWPLADFSRAFREVEEGKVVKGFLEM